MRVVEQGCTDLFRFLCPTVFLQPKIGLVRFTTVPIVSKDLSKSGNWLMAWVLGKEGAVWRYT